MLAGVDVWTETVARILVELRPSAYDCTQSVTREELERMYPLTPQQRCQQYFAKQREIARELAK